MAFGQEEHRFGDQEWSCYMCPGEESRLREMKLLPFYTIDTCLGFLASECVCS